MEENKLEIHYIQGDELRPFGISAHTKRARKSYA